MKATIKQPFTWMHKKVINILVSENSAVLDPPSL